MSRGGIFGRLMGSDRRKVGGDEPLSYEEARAFARHEDAEVRRLLAARKDTRPEILYYLADDDEASVRRELATNAATPRQADLVLARDVDSAVRLSLADKITRLAPDLSPDQLDRVERLTVEVLETLARDQLPRVRQIVAEGIKQLDNVPKSLVDRLARDVEAMVAAPVLEFSPLLTDEDLLEIIRTGRNAGAADAISRRRGLSGEVSDAVAATDDTAAIATLLANPSAQIREETLDNLISRAPDREPWHEPLVNRADMPNRFVGRIVRFVSASLLQTLAKRHDLDPDTARLVASAIRRRLPGGDDGGKAQAADDPPRERAKPVDAAPAMKTAAAKTATIKTAGAEEGGDRESAVERVRAAQKRGDLDEKTVLEALDEADEDFVYQALSVLAEIDIETVKRIVASKSARAVTALAWKAGFAMRAGIQLQQRLARIPSSNWLHAREGVYYPLSAEEMEKMLALFSR